MTAVVTLCLPRLRAFLRPADTSQNRAGLIVCIGRRRSGRSPDG